MMHSQSYSLNITFDVTLISSSSLLVTNIFNSALKIILDIMYNRTCAHTDIERYISTFSVVNLDSY